MKKVLLFLIIPILGCKQSQQYQLSDNINEIDYCYSGCTIYIQPYEDFSVKEVNKIIPELKKQFDHWLYGEWIFKILNPVSLPKNSNLINYNKYEAIEILNFQNRRIKNNEVIIGLTHKDICKDIHNIKHYGIVGLSYSPGNVCIVSDKRLKDKSQIWKPILHEFIHAYYGEKHCPNNDPTCFMVDAKGKGNFAIQNKLCNSCNKQ